MNAKHLDSNALGPTEDWEGNNIALACPVCGKVYLVSEVIHGERKCPACGKSRGNVKGGRKSGGKALIAWESPFTDGEVLTREAISARVGGSQVDYLPTENGRVVCGCFRLDSNPEAPNVILPGTGPVIQQTAELLCKQGGFISVFIKRRPLEWEYVGEFMVERHSQDSVKIAEHHAGSKTPLSEISRVIFLKPATQL